MNETRSTKAAVGHYQPATKDTLIFDSHGYVKRMTDGGFNEKQAAALAAEQADLLNNLATRQDIETVKDDLETVKTGLETVKRNMATRDDLENMATKDDLENFATKDDLENFAIKYNLENMATKDDLKNMAIKYNLENMATKQDVEVSVQRLKVEMIKWMTWYFLSGIAVMAAAMTAMTAVLKLT